MTPQKTKTTTESIALFKQTLEGNNYSPQSIKAYMGDLGQFVEWLKTRRVDWDIPYRMAHSHRHRGAAKRTGSGRASPSTYRKGPESISML
jgi:hypothetical protein